MSIGEFDSPSKPASEAYREGWDRVFAAMDGLALQAASSTRLRFSGDSFEFLPENELRLLTVKDGEPSVFTITNIGKEEITGYKNGCPILPHE